MKRAKKQRKVNFLSNFIQAHGLECSIADVALAWVEGTPGVTSAIIGPRNLVQLEQILNGRIELPLPIRQVLSEVSAK